MFEDIFKWELQRSNQQAFGFYLATLGIGLLIGGVCRR